MRDNSHLQLVHDAEKREAERTCSRRAFRDHPPAATKAFIALPADADDFDDMSLAARAHEAGCTADCDQGRKPCRAPDLCYSAAVLDAEQPGAPVPSPALSKSSLWARVCAWFVSPFVWE
jgi:hypothetical protein